MARVREGKIKYKITDNLYIYNNGKADFLVYLNVTFKDTNNINIYEIEKMINRGKYCEFILNMNNVENSTSKLIQPYIKALRRVVYQETPSIALYIFLLKLRYYIDHITDVLLAKELYDQYNKIREDNNFVYTMVDYLLDKRRSEQTLQKWKSILKEDIDMFAKLYNIMKETKYIEEERDILQHYNKFRIALIEGSKTNQNVNTNATNQ
jgi:hypothetical protein